MSVIVRGYRFGSDDWEQLDELIEAEAGDLNRDEWDALELSRKLQELADPNSLGRRTSNLLLAYDGDRLAGFVALRRHYGDRHDHIADLRLHVRREYRSNGVGAKLLRRALWWADRNNITRVVATPYLDPNRPPLAWVSKPVDFFEQHGFDLEGVQYKAARLLDGTYTDVALMARVI